MFRMVSQRTAWWPVRFAGVAEDGAIVEHEIELRFVILDEDQVAGFYAEIEAATARSLQPEAPPGSACLLPVLMSVVTDWRKVHAENGEPLPFGADAFQSLLRVPNAGAAIGRAYGACRQAAPEARAGN